MAIDSRPLLLPEPAEPMDAGVELVLTECHNARPDEQIGPRDCDFRSVNVLINCSADLGDRAALHGLPYALTFGRTSTAVFAGTEWPERLRARLRSVETHFASATIYVGADAIVVVETVEAAVAALRHAFGAKLAVLVVVSATPSRWSELRGVSGFVRGVQLTNTETARQVFLALAMFGAPRTLNGIDVVDLLAALGSAHEPSILAEALWLRDDEGRLVAVSEVDERAIRQAGRLVAVPFVQGWNWTELRRFRRAVCAAVGEHSAVTVFAAVDALCRGLLPAQVGWVPVLCCATTDADISPAAGFHFDSLPLTPTTQGE